MQGELILCPRPILFPLIRDYTISSQFCGGKSEPHHKVYIHRKFRYITEQRLTGTRGKPTIR